MERKRKLATIAATFFLAAATGQYMQDQAGHSAKVRGAGPNVPHVTAPADPQTPLRAALPGLPTSPALPSRAALRLAPAADHGAGGVARALAVPADCVANLGLSPKPGAMLHLSFLAPCNASERVVVRIGALEITALTSPRGTLDLTLPALQSPVETSVRLAGGTTIAAQADIPDMDRYSRVAVQWRGQDAFRLDAREFGAARDTTGAVSPDSPPAPGTIRGGFLSRLGDATVQMPMLAQVYTLPREQSTGGRADLLVEAPVTPSTCGREMHGQVLRSGGTPSEVSLTMPPCHPAIQGQFVALPGLVPSLEVAAR